jgi:hypothetical protein
MDPSDKPETHDPERHCLSCKALIVRRPKEQKGHFEIRSYCGRKCFRKGGKRF